MLRCELNKIIEREKVWGRDKNTGEANDIIHDCFVRRLHVAEALAEVQAIRKAGCLKLADKHNP
jgi:hypothetical protein